MGVMMVMAVVWHALGGTVAGLAGAVARILVACTYGGKHAACCTRSSARAPSGSQ